MAANKNFAGTITSKYARFYSQISHSKQGDVSPRDAQEKIRREKNTDYHGSHSEKYLSKSRRSERESDSGSKHKRQSKNRSPSTERRKSSDHTKGSSRSKERPRSRNRSRSRDRFSRSSHERYRSRSKERGASTRHHDRERSPERRRVPGYDLSHKSPVNEDHKKSDRERSRSPPKPTFQNKNVMKAAAQQYCQFANASKDFSGVALANIAPGTPMTPQLVLQQTMAAMSVQAQTLTGVALPKYYNPAAVNPLKYAEQIQKRKLLWKSKEKPPEKTEVKPGNSSASHWEKTTFVQDDDGKMSAKFRKLMGLKNSSGELESSIPEKKLNSSKAPPEAPLPDVIQKQEALFRDLDQQYETARMTTHTMRGVGLGYSSQPQMLIYPK